MYPWLLRKETTIFHENITEKNATMHYVIFKFLSRKSMRNQMTFIHFLKQRNPRRCRNLLSPRDYRCWSHRVPAPSCTRK